MLKPAFSVGDRPLCRAEGRGDAVVSEDPRRFLVDRLWRVVWRRIEVQVSDRVWEVVYRG